MKTKLVTQLAFFTALALCLSGLEAMLPVLVPIYGVKLGLANIVTLIMLTHYKPYQIAFVCLSRILLSTLLFGQIISLAYSLAGGFLCLLVCLLLHHFLSGHYIILTSIMGALAHNLGQIAAAVILTSSLAVLGYLPVLCISGILTGLFTGLCTRFIRPYLRRLGTQA